MKQAYQLKNHPNYSKNKRSFNGSLTRLKWRCHFIQKFEVECEIENYALIERLKLGALEQQRVYQSLERRKKQGFHWLMPI